MTVNISLTPQQEARVRERVKSGEYASVSEVVRTALRLLDHEERLRDIQLRELREEVLIGVKQAETGEVKPFDKKTIESIKQRGHERLNRNNN
jgi:antitoxin ParD1/3/4